METETNFIIKTKLNSLPRNNKKCNKVNIKLYFFLFLFFINFGSLISSKIINLHKKNYILNFPIKQLNNTINKTSINMTNTTTNNILNGEFNQLINDRYRKEQYYFCENQNFFYNKELEDKIELINIQFEDKKYNIFIYKKFDIVSNEIIKYKMWEKNETKILINCLDYYSIKKNITNKDIYIIDIGANLGWYSFVLGKKGYNIISFEPSKINNYILKKNFCLNNETNVTIINKGLYTEEKICDLYNLYHNEGNGMIICDKQNISSNLLLKSKAEIVLTKLSNYIPFFSDKNLALIKIDIEGSEGKAFEGGIELITKYHVPFIFLEYTPTSLKLHGTDPNKFLHLFIDNGYKVSLNNFFENYINIDDLLKRKFTLMNLYIVYSKILE